MKATIGQNIAKYRKLCGLTQAELAEKLNVSVQAVSKWENDVSCPDIERIGELASTLNTSAESIISGESVTQVKKADDLSRRLLAISVKHTEGNENVDVNVRIPAELIPKMKDNGALKALIGGESPEIDMALEMIQSGVVGPIVDVKTEDTIVKIEVMDYEN